MLQSSKTDNIHVTNNSSIVLNVPDKSPLMKSGEMKNTQEELKINQNYPSPLYVNKTDEELESDNDEPYSSSSDET